MIISIVVPCYNEEEIINIFYKETKKYLLELIDSTNITQYEFIFINDGSKDNTIEIIRKLKKEDKNVHYISFSRNFGKEAALYAGLNKSVGDYIAVMDCDLQDPPSLLKDMLYAIQIEKYDCAATRRTTRKNEPFIRSIFSKAFYKLMGKMSDVEIVDGARDFRLMTKKYKDAVISLKEKNRFTKGIFPWVGFKTKWFEYENIERVGGTTKWSFGKLFKYSIDGIVGFSTKPLALVSIFGILDIFISFILLIVIIVNKLLYGNPVQGWASLVCIIIFIGGIQLFSIGILGIYLSKIYIEVKNRPFYIIDEEK